jgi:hypothetical protein
MTKPRRTKHFIDSCVQGALARRIIFHWLVFLLVSSVVAFVLQVLSNPFRPLMEHVSDLWRTQGLFLLVMIFLLPVFVIDTVKLSHRFAGPIYSLRRSIREVIQGKPARRLKFRRRDFWHDLADDYNALLLRLDLLQDESRNLASAEETLAGSER